MTEETFARELERHADRVQGGPLPLEAVRGRARRIKRRRRTAVAAGVAAAVAAVVLAPTALTGGSGERTAPDPAAPSPTPQADGTFRLTLDVPSGDAPGVPYLDFVERTLMTPDGPVALPRDWTQLLPYRGGWVAVSGRDGAELDDRLEPVRTFEAGGGMTASDDGARLAWVEREGDRWIVVNASTDGDEVRTTMDAEVTPVGFLPDDSLVVESIEGGLAWIVATDGSTSELGGFQWVRDASPATGMVAAQTDFRGVDTACSIVIDPATSRPPYWEECGWSLGEFSPDGRHIVAFGPREGPLPTELAVLDAATGEPVVEFSGAEVGHAAWEDDTTVLAATVEDGRQAVLRLGLDGSVTRATEPVPVEPMSVRLWFMTTARE